jgi:hypothetical protein
MAARDGSSAVASGSGTVIAGRSPGPAAVTLVAGAAITISLIAAVLLHWPLAAPLIAVARLLIWVVVTLYVAVPVLAVGRLLTRRLRLDPAPGAWRLVAAWGVGWIAVVLIGTVLLGCGLYTPTIWVTLALLANVAILAVLVARRWRPLTELRAEVADAWRSLCAHRTSGWDLAILLCLASAALLASLPPDARDELAYHLALPRFWGFQHSWWVPLDNLHWLFPANAELIWGYGMAAGGIHVPRLLTLAFGLATLTMLADWLAENEYDQWTVRISLLFLVLAPMSLTLLGITNAEWLLLFFLLLGWRAGRRYLATPHRSDAVLTALAWGVALGIKYTAFPVVVGLAIEWLVAVARTRGARRALAGLTALVLAAALLAGGWLARNWRSTGDPLYPLGAALSGSPAAAEATPDVHSLLDYSHPSGPWRFFPLLYHATVDGVIDQRLHLGWPLLLVGVVALGWRRLRDRPWFSVVAVWLLLLRFSPATRAYVPLMGLAWLFLPDALRTVAHRRWPRLAASATMVLLLLTSLPWFYVVLAKYSPGAGDYLLGRISDAEFLRQSGVVTPVVKWVEQKTPSDARVWLWCGEQTFYFERWARASSYLDPPLFLTWFAKYGSEGFSRHLAEARVGFIVVETSNCPALPTSVHTELGEWPVAPGLRPVITGWMRDNLRETVHDDSFVLYRVVAKDQP